jgi:hypothetical protein
MSLSSISARLNRALFPVLGPAQVGPYEESRVSVKPCPLCGQPMDAHDIERSPGKPSYLHCPAV